MPDLPRFPSPPTTDTPASWKRYVGRLNATWTGYAIRLSGWGESVVVQRVETAECLDRERAAGRIR